MKQASLQGPMDFYKGLQPLNHSKTIETALAMAALGAGTGAVASGVAGGLRGREGRRGKGRLAAAGGGALKGLLTGGLIGGGLGLIAPTALNAVADHKIRGAVNERLPEGIPDPARKAVQEFSTAAARPAKDQVTAEDLFKFLRTKTKDIAQKLPQFGGPSPEAGGEVNDAAPAAS